jgi:osmotically-inducible protein OsmY
MHTKSSETILKDRSASIIEQIESRIRRRVGGRLSNLQVAIQRGGVVLRGRTQTHHAKQLALQAAMESSELPILANEIRVGQDSGLDPPGSAESPGDRSPDDATRRWGKPVSESMTSFFVRIGAIWFRNRTPETRR